jgi:hypothetical protein
MSDEEEFPAYYIIGHSALVKDASIPLPENTCLLTYSKCGENVAKNSKVKQIELRFFQHPRTFPRNIITGWRELKAQVNDANLRIKVSPAKYHNQITKLCSFWYSDSQGNQVDNEREAVNLKLARSGIYLLDRTRSLSRYVDIIIQKELGNRDIIVSRLQIGDIYAGALFPTVENLDTIFGENTMLPFEVFHSAFRKLTMRMKFHTLTGIFNKLGEGAYFLTSACRSMLENDVTEEEINAMRASSEEAYALSEHILGVGTRKNKYKRKKRKKSRRMNKLTN